MEIRILGPAQVVDGSSSELSIGGPQQRRLLAALVLRHRDVICADELAEMLWGQDQPDDAAGALRQGITRLRRVIGTDSILTVAPGYVLQESAQTFEAGRQSSSAPTIGTCSRRRPGQHDSGTSLPGYRSAIRSAAATSETAVIRFTTIDEGHANAWTL